MLIYVRWVILSAMFWIALCNFLLSLITEKNVEQALTLFALTIAAIVSSIIIEIVGVREQDGNK